MVLVGEDTLPTCTCHLEALFPHHLSTADDDTVLPVDEDTVLTSSSLPLYSSLPSLPSFCLSSLPTFSFYLPSSDLFAFLTSAFFFFFCLLYIFILFLCLLFLSSCLLYHFLFMSITFLFPSFLCLYFLCLLFLLANTSSSLFIRLVSNELTFRSFSFSPFQLAIIIAICILAFFPG